MTVAGPAPPLDRKQRVQRNQERSLRGSDGHRPPLQQIRTQKGHALL